jgi:tetratricopeptide (TPR) repeat protein
MVGEVKAWSDIVQIPTYGVGKPENIPLFLETRVYQGSSGVVYPYPVIENIHDEKTDRSYTALFLENEYLKIMVLPEIGGRVQMAIDKTNGFKFVYHNQVIKPALVGLTGPWIAGGIEFNWPQHHRPSTFDPLDWRIDENQDGSKTIWCSEIEKMSRMKGMHGFTLYPDRAYLEVKVQLHNRTSEPQPFLWWANPAIHVNNDTQAVFPPDVYAVMDHGKRAVSEFPYAKGVYYQVDYSPSTDISFFKNVPVPTSYMAYHSNFDFLGSYDHGQKAGMLHVADHHVVPGKKMWTWGNGSFGAAWIKELTDEDGPYVELMCGAYTDNQPDFSWLMPGEEKSFSQYFFPYKEIGPPQIANKEGAVNLKIQNDEIHFGVYLTSERITRVQLYTPHGLVYEQRVELSPQKAIKGKLPVEPGILEQELTLSVFSDEVELITYSPIGNEKDITPEPQKAIPPAHTIDNIEELYLCGLHLEQYRHGLINAEDYYREALQRDPFDSRCNTALGLLLYRRGCFIDAEGYFQTAIRSLTRHNPNPYDSEAFYHLGLALKMQNRYDEAYRAFYKATWNAKWQDSSYFELARISCRQGDYEQALEFTRRALRRNYFNHKTRHLRIALLRRLNRMDAALRETSLALELDRMEYGAMWERYLLVQDSMFAKLTHQNPNTLIEVALDYIHAGLFLEAIALLRRVPIPDPLASYYLGWCNSQLGDDEQALEVFRVAAQLPTDYCFPNQIECVPAFQTAQKLNNDDSLANYYLGNFWYAHKNYMEAIACWEKAYSIGLQLPSLCRNLGFAYYNHLRKPESALAFYEQAFNLDPGNGRILFELDQMYKKLNHPPQGRLMRLEAYSSLVDNRDDLTLEKVKLLNLLGKYDDAYTTMTSHRFHPWEGGEGKVPTQYILCLVQKAKQRLGQRNYPDAIELLNLAMNYPPNLGEGKLPNQRDNHINYYLGLAHKALGDTQQANQYFYLATLGEISYAPPRYYNEPSPEMAYYQCLANLELGSADWARTILNQMIDFGQEHIDDNVEVDFFAVSLPDFLGFNEDLNLKNRIHCNYLLGLGMLGSGEIDKAIEYFERVLIDDVSHIGATIHRQDITTPIS